MCMSLASTRFYCDCWKHCCFDLPTSREQCRDSRPQTGINYWQTTGKGNPSLNVALVKSECGCLHGKSCCVCIDATEDSFFLHVGSWVIPCLYFFCMCVRSACTHQFPLFRPQSVQSGFVSLDNCERAFSGGLHLSSFP